MSLSPELVHAFKYGLILLVAFVSTALAWGLAGGGGDE